MRKNVSMATLKQNIFILQQTMQVGREERRKASMILFRRKFFDFIQTIDFKLHHGDHCHVSSMPVTSPDKGGVLDGRDADTAVCKRTKTKETNHERIQRKSIPARTAPGQTRPAYSGERPGQNRKIGNWKEPRNDKKHTKDDTCKGNLDGGNVECADPVGRRKTRTA